MEYVVLKLGGRQYRVSKGDILEIDKMEGKKGQEFTLSNALLFVSNGKVHVGKPALSNVKVKAKILDQKKGEKIRVAKFKAKVRYRRVMGFRPSLTQLQIVDIKEG
ncbi:MAG: 50S ribosomal protein L21 [Candidatus Levybacteria bacterium]|nr:50S ribosomal protein L21 [Candidatus Levybacteria bacterium]